MEGVAFVARLAALADDDLRIARRIMAAQAGRGKPLADVSRAGRRIAALCEADGLHAYRTVADHGTPARCFLGISDRRLFRGDQPFRFARGFHVFRGPLPPARNRRDSGLDAGAFPARRAWPGIIRWHASLRARRPEARRASGLGHTGLQLWPERSAEFLGVERAFLARQISPRRIARGCSGFHAVPRLFAQAWRVDSERLWRPRKSGSDCVSETFERSATQQASRRADDCRRVHFVARGFAPDVCRRPGFRSEMEHGLDERHAALFRT